MKTAAKTVIEGSSVTAFQLAELFRQIGEGRLNSRHIQALIDGDNSWGLSYGGLVGDELNQCKGWESFYHNHFGVSIDFSKIVIPKRTASERKEFTRLLIVAEGLTNNQVYEACEKHFKCWRYAEDLNKGVPTNERDSRNVTYAIWVRDTVEADEVHKNKSADMIKQENLKTETLLERMLHELKFFLETGKHLDVASWTLCSGSRNSAGGVPYTYWDDGEFGVDWDGTDNQDDFMRPRQAVSCP